MSAFILLTVLTALRVLSRNRLRAGLTMLGIVIGVAAVIALVSIGQGARAAVRSQVASMGTNVIVVLPGATTVGGVRGGQGTAVTLTVSDGVELKKRIPLLVDTGWARRDVMQIVNGNRNWNGPVNGISPGYLMIRDWAYTSGGPFTQVDVDSAARVALIGQTTVENLFDAGEEPVGATIRIKNVPFRIVGVLTPKGQSAQGSDQDDVLFIPFTTAERKVFGSQFLGAVGALFASTERPEDLPEAVDQIREVLRIRHRLQPEQPDDFTIRTQVDIGSVQEGTSHTLDRDALCDRIGIVTGRRDRNHEHSVGVRHRTDAGDRDSHGGGSQAVPYSDAILDRSRHVKCDWRADRHWDWNYRSVADDHRGRLADHHFSRLHSHGIHLFRRGRSVFWVVSCQ